MGKIQPITLGIAVPNIRVVHPSVAAASVQELVALARAKPGQIAFASAGNGTSGHVALEVFKEGRRQDRLRWR